MAERAAEMATSELVLRILNELVRGTVDEWDRRGTMELAVKVLQGAVGLEQTPDYARLQTTLLERGAM